MSTEPCGSLPVTSLHLMVTYCHHHMAWHATCSTAHQTSEDSIKLTHLRSCTFGPFDAWGDVTRWVEENLFDPSVESPA